VPKAGPMARNANAHRQPTTDASCGVSCTVMAEIRKPMLVWSVSAVDLVFD